MSESKTIKNPFPGLRPFERTNTACFSVVRTSDALMRDAALASWLCVTSARQSHWCGQGWYPRCAAVMADAAPAAHSIMRPGRPIGNLALTLLTRACCGKQAGFTSCEHKRDRAHCGVVPWVSEGRKASRLSDTRS